MHNETSKSRIERQDMNARKR